MLQTLQTQPGVTRAGDGADLYVRGGDPEETPVFMNGGRVAYPGRWESLNGATSGLIDANVLSSAYFSAGGFSAKYGNALSGVVDVQTRGRPEAPAWRVGANLVSLGGSLFQPLFTRSGVWGTAMLTDVSLLTRLQGTTGTYPDAPRSYQAVVGGSTSVSSTLELKAVALVAGDVSSRVIDAGGYRGTFRSEGDSRHLALTTRWLRPDARLGMTGGMTYSRRDARFDFGLLRRDRVDEAYAARVDVDVIVSDATRVRSGVELNRLSALTSGQVPLTPDLNEGSPALILAGEPESTVHAGGYVEAERTLVSRLVGVIGLRADRLPGADAMTLDPRAALAYTSGDWTLRAGAGLFRQGAWRRTYRLPDASAPDGVPTRARHIIVGAERAGEPAVRVEAWSKQYDGYVAVGGGGPAIEEGSAHGLDAIVRWQRQARVNGWITWSLMDASVTMADGASASARFDITHTLTGVARAALSDAWELGTTVRYATGKPYTPVIGSRPAEVAGAPIEPTYGGVHAARVPDYLRVDGRITRYQPIAGRTGVFYLEMLDLNGRRNILSYQYDRTWTRREPMESFFARRTFVLGAELGF
jgi:hypothetical protein